MTAPPSWRDAARRGLEVRVCVLGGVITMGPPEDGGPGWVRTIRTAEAGRVIQTREYPDMSLVEAARIAAMSAPLLLSTHDRNADMHRDTDMAAHRLPVGRPAPWGPPPRPHQGGDRRVHPRHPHA